MVQYASFNIFVCSLEYCVVTCNDPFFSLSAVDVTSTLFVIFEIHEEKPPSWRKFPDLPRPVTEKLADIPDCTKLLITSQESDRLKIAETLLVSYYPYDRIRDDVLATILEVFYKRWETLDIVSMMKEVERTVNRTRERFHRGWSEVLITDNLSTLPRLHRTEEDP